MMRKIRHFCLLFLLFESFFVKGQDPSFSQFYLNQLYFNPAFCGLSRGLSTSFTHRILWPNLPGKFNTSKFSADIDISNNTGLGGVGIIVISDIEGNKFIKTNTFGIPFTSRVKLSDKSIVQFGISTSVIYKSINWEKFVFGDQLDPVDGIADPSNASVPFHSSMIFPDFGTGFVYEYRNAPFKPTQRKTYMIKFGIAANHIFQPDYSFLNASSKLPIKWVGHINGEIPLINNTDLIIAPAFIFEKQKSMKTMFFGSNALWRNLFVGAWYRAYTNVDALTFVAGLKFGTLTKSYISYSHDFTLSKLISGTGGSNEINLTYIIDEKLIYALGLGNKKKPRAFVEHCAEF
ncbi:MAG: PorP/SprF family type IX secretion system membrane protein [Bacteroidetes bacterium]|nr:PorP/SprF family type IX secretion system membrane protein [Bacteroidota bacterium]